MTGARGFRIRAPRPGDARALAAFAAANNRRHGLPDGIFTEAVVERDLLGPAPWCDAHRSSFSARGVYLWWAPAEWNVEAQGFGAALGASEESARAHALTRTAFDQLCKEAEHAD